MRFSIVIPVYNVAEFLRDCLDSVCAQSHSDWEAICVDDGSTDASPVILDEYAQMDSRIRVVHQPNAGEGAARNTALALVTGEYFTFLDSDDVLAPRTLQTANVILQETRVDGLISRPLCTELVSEEDVRSFLSRDATVSSAQILSSPAEFLKPVHLVLGLVCGRFYLTRAFVGIRMPVGLSMFEDLWYWHDVVRMPARWAEIQGAFYGYRMRAGSAVHTDSPQRSMDAFAALIHAMENVSTLPGATPASVNAYWQHHRAFALTLVRSFFALSKGVRRADVQAFVSRMETIQGYLPSSAFDFVSRMLAWCGRYHLPYAAIRLVFAFDWLRGGVVARWRRVCGR